jgi:hypothetical protein
MIDDNAYRLNLTPHEIFALIHIFGEWQNINPHIVGPCAQFVSSLMSKINEWPYPFGAAADFQRLTAEALRNKARMNVRIPPQQQPLEPKVTSRFYCPTCNSGVDVEIADFGGFCFTCEKGYRRESLKESTFSSSIN